MKIIIKQDKETLSGGGGVDYFRQGVMDNQNEAMEPVMWMDIWGEHCTSKGKDLNRNIL